jgi:glucose-6-phosphate-specific signal transduction histidine kinase
VAVSESDGRLLIAVQDDGSGFDPETVSRGFGLAGMQERVSLAGGTLSVESGVVVRDQAGTLTSREVNLFAVSERCMASKRGAIRGLMYS